MADTAPETDIEADPETSLATPTSLLWRLATQPNAVLKVADLPTIWGMPETQAAGMLAHLVNTGDAELWPEKAAVLLSPAAGERLGLELIPDNRNRLKWENKGSRDAEGRKDAAMRPAAERRKGKRRVIVETDLAGDDEGHLLDELPGPTSAELAETTQPTLLYGCGLIWRGPSTEPKRGQRCKGCGHEKKMPAIGYCLLCCRSGNTRLRTPVLPTATVAKPVAEAQPDSVKFAPKAAELAGGTGRTTGRKQGKKQSVKIA